MVPRISLLVLLVGLIDAIPSPPFKRKRGRPPTYPDRLFLKALVIMLVRDVTTVDRLLAMLDQPTLELRALRERLTLDGRSPSRRTWERRLNALPGTLPARIGCLGRHLVGRIDPWAGGAQAVAIDSTVLPARGGGDVTDQLGGPCGVGKESHVLRLDLQPGPAWIVMAR